VKATGQIKIVDTHIEEGSNQKQGRTEPFERLKKLFSLIETSSTVRMSFRKEQRIFPKEGRIVLPFRFCVSIIFFGY
jgi:hypothetical protein